MQIGLSNAQRETGPEQKSFTVLIDFELQHSTYTVICKSLLGPRSKLYFEQLNMFKETEMEA